MALSLHTKMVRAFLNQLTPIFIFVLAFVNGFYQSAGSFQVAPRRSNWFAKDSDAYNISFIYLFFHMFMG